MNEINKGLRGLGGTKMVIDIEYADLVIACKLCIDEVTADNGAEFDTNLEYFLEGLKEDINFLTNGEECGVIPKTQDFEA